MPTPEWVADDRPGRPGHQQRRLVDGRLPGPGADGDHGIVRGRRPQPREPARRGGADAADSSPRAGAAGRRSIRARDRSPEASRQLASRARRHVQGETAIPDADLDTQREVVDAFLAATREGDFEALLEVLDPDVVRRTDRGAVSIGASRVVRGAANVARRALVFSRLDIEVRPILVNGAVGTVTLRDGRPFAIAACTIRNRRIVEMDFFTDPERLSQLDLTILD